MRYTTKTYGAGSTAFTADGLLNGDAIDTVTLADPEGGGLEAAAVGTYPLEPSVAVFSVGTPDNYDINYVDGTLTVNLPLRLMAEADVQVGTAGPIGTAQTPDVYDVVFGVNETYLDGNLFQINAAGELTFKAAPENNVGDVYYVEVTAEEQGDPANNDKMLVKVTVVGTEVTGTIFILR